MKLPAPNALVGGTLIGFLGIVASVSAVTAMKGLFIGLQPT